MNSNEEIVDYYDQTEIDYKLAWFKKDNPALHFGFYEKEKAESHYEALSHTNRVLSNKVNIKDGDKILDAGCGLGGSVFWLAKNYNVEVTGISLSSKQIQSCKERADSLSLMGQTNFVTSDFTKTPFESNSFDVVWAIESICHAAKKFDFYKEAFRVLKPGGKIIIAEYIRDARPLTTEDEKLLKNKWLNNWAVDDIDTEQEHKNHMQQAGFQDSSLENVNDKIKVSLRNLHEKCIRSLPLELLLRLFRIRSKVQHDNLIGSINQYKAFKKNLWWYSLISAQKPE